MQYKKMFKMDFSFSFSLPCMLIILTITSGKICTASNSTLQSNLSGQQESKCAHPVKVCMNCLYNCLNDRILQSCNLSKEDEGKCPENETFFCCICDLPPTVHIHCLPDGKMSLSCEIGGQFNGSIYWTLNGSLISDACIKDDGMRFWKRVYMASSFATEETTVGVLLSSCCIITISYILPNFSYWSSKCYMDKYICIGNLLQHPLFLYVLIACGGGAVLLAITASLITCCCMKTKHNFIRVPVEDEKDEGITMSAISSERPKSSPNGDHCEVTDVLVDSTPNTSAPTCESFKPDHKEDPNPSVGPEVKSESRREEKVGTETEFQEVTVDNAAQEVIDDCFPDPIDA